MFYDLQQSECCPNSQRPRQIRPRENAIMRDLPLFYFFPLSLTRTPNFR
jgi:hypothetical protein